MSTIPSQPDPGAGWRLLAEGEPLQPGDGFWTGHHPDWIDYDSRPDIFKGAGVEGKSDYYIPANDTAHTWPWRRKVAQPAPSKLAIFSNLLQKRLSMLAAEFDTMTGAQCRAVLEIEMEALKTLADALTPNLAPE